MTTINDFLAADSFGFASTTAFVRQRATLVTDPYDPDAPGAPDWENPDEIDISGYFASQSSVEQSDLVRAQVVTTRQLILDDPDADVRRGDRIRLGSKVWTVVGFPETDVNPWTGWQPTLVANLEEVQG